MKTTKRKALDWFNGLSKIDRDELSLNYYGSLLLLDDEIEEIYLREMPQEETYAREQVRLNFMWGLASFAAEKGLTPSSKEMKEVNEWGDNWIKENL